MSEEFKEIRPRDIPGNVFTLIGSDWMLITAGTRAKFNTMTASWGGMGVIWNKNVAACVIRPQRYTREFMDAASRFTLTFFDRRYRDALNLAGTKSGREVDKVAATGLTPVFSPSGAIYFAEARLVMECVKIYTDIIDPAGFIDKSIATNYPEKDYHHLYLGEVVQCLIK